MKNRFVDTQMIYNNYYKFKRPTQNVSFILTLSFQSYYTHIFNGCYAVLLFIVVVLFLIYGIEVFFKVDNSLQIHKSVIAQKNQVTQKHEKNVIEEFNSIHLFLYF